jgi:hypothetical protein
LAKAASSEVKPTATPDAVNNTVPAPATAQVQAPVAAIAAAPSEVIGDSIAGAFDSLPGFEGANATIVAQKGITIEDSRKNGDPNMKSLVKSIVSTIEPALSALGTQNHAAVSVIIKDTDDE